MKAVPVPPIEMELFNRNDGVVTELCVYSFNAIHIDLMLIFEDAWVVGTTQNTKYDRFDKTSLARHNPGWWICCDASACACIV